MPRKLTQSEFEDNVRAVFGNRYDFSQAHYQGARSPVTLICQLHGHFVKTPDSLINGKQDCPACSQGRRRRLATDSTGSFIAKAMGKYGTKFRYDKVQYVSSASPIVIVCLTHGDFSVRPAAFLRGRGCPDCGLEMRTSARRLTREQFVEAAQRVHGTKYDYSNVVYVNNSTNVKIGCPIHGPIESTPANHLNSRGCRECGIAGATRKRSSNSQAFVEKAKGIHGETFDYKLVEYINAKTKVKIGCRVHGTFDCTPSNHLSLKRGCPSCAPSAKNFGPRRGRKLSQEQFLERAKAAHPESEFDFSTAQYKGNRIPVIISCLEHGAFAIRPHNLWNGGGCAKCATQRNGKRLRVTEKELLRRFHAAHGDRYDYSDAKLRGVTQPIVVNCRSHGPFRVLPANHQRQDRGGCPRCAELEWGAVVKELNTKTLKEVIDEFQNIHLNRYDYSLVQYVNTMEKVEIRCRTHGTFWQSHRSHVRGKGCPDCAKIKKIRGQRSTLEEILTIFERVHGSRYDYSKVKYTDNKHKIEIHCQDHGSFIQSPNVHRAGKGCPKCSLSKGENAVALWLERHNFDFEVESPIRIGDSNSRLRFDFYLPELDLYIEYDGQQHFEPVTFGGMDTETAKRVFLENKARDETKNAWVRANNKRLIRIAYFEDVAERLTDKLRNIGKSESQ